jgi:hypothetical protein
MFFAFLSLHLPLSKAMLLFLYGDPLAPGKILKRVDFPLDFLDKGLIGIFWRYLFK